MPGRTTGIVARLSPRRLRLPGPLHPATGCLDTICPIVLSGGAAGAVHVFAQGALIEQAEARGAGEAPRQEAQDEGESARRALTAGSGGVAQW